VASRVLHDKAASGLNLGIFVCLAIVKVGPLFIGRGGEGGGGGGGSDRKQSRPHAIPHSVSAQDRDYSNMERKVHGRLTTAC
jgi:hypothetical protein